MEVVYQTRARPHRVVPGMISNLGLRLAQEHEPGQGASHYANHDNDKVGPTIIPVAW